MIIEIPPYPDIGTLLSTIYVEKEEEVQLQRQISIPIDLVQSLTLNSTRFFVCSFS